MIRGPEVASRDEMESLVELSEVCFPKDRDAGGMLPRWPHCFMSNSTPFVIRDGGRIVSQVICVDQSVMVGSKTLRVGGISGVCTHPDYRGRGFMTKLLRYAIAYMRTQGFAISDLGGDTQRYRRFGWENAGRRCVYRITKRSLSATAPPEGFVALPYEPTQANLTSTLTLHNQEGWGLRRDEALHRALLGRLGKETWLCAFGDRLECYAVVERSAEYVKIVEVAGSEDGFHFLVQHLCDLGTEALSVSLPFGHHLSRRAWSLSSGFHISPLRMIRLLNLKETLEVFADQMAERFSSLGLEGERRVCLAVRDVGGEQKVSVEFTGESVSVHDRAGSSCKGVVSLSPGSMAAFLFGPLGPSVVGPLPERAQFIESVLPLDFYLWENEGV